VKLGFKQKVKSHTVIGCCLITVVLMGLCVLFSSPHSIEVNYMYVEHWL